MEVPSVVYFTQALIDQVIEDRGCCLVFLGLRLELTKLLLNLGQFIQLLLCGDGELLLLLLFSLNLLLSPPSYGVNL